jgi:hypothetical protein
MTVNRCGRPVRLTWDHDDLHQAAVEGHEQAVVGVLVRMLAAEQLLIPTVPAVGRWTPGGATYGLLQLGPAISADGKLLSAPVGGLVLVGYTATGDRATATYRSI